MPFCITIIFSEYLTFQKIEKADYSFPEGFHDVGKTLIEKMLKAKWNERLGSGRKHDQITSDPFYQATFLIILKYFKLSYIL